MERGPSGEVCSVVPLFGDGVFLNRHWMLRRSLRDAKSSSMAVARNLSSRQLGTRIRDIGIESVEGLAHWRMTLMFGFLSGVAMVGLWGLFVLFIRGA